MKILAAVILALGALAALAGCTPARDASVPPSRSPWTACPHGDAGRIQDKWLRPPDWWVCVRV